MKKIILLIIVFFTALNVKALEINSQNAILYNLDNNSIVLEKNAYEKVRIASLTKIMTNIIAIETITNYEEKITITKQMLNNPSDAAVVGLKLGDIVTYNDLLYASMLASGADATKALAHSISKSENEFVILMNNKARELNLKNTTFSDSTGLDDLTYSSADDIASLLKYALNNDKFKEVFATKDYVIRNLNLPIKSTLGSIDVDFIKGAKTGFTDLAGRCLASISFDKDNNINYLLVTLGADKSKQMYNIKDAINIYEDAFANYKNYTLVKKNDLLTTVKIKYGKLKTMKFYNSEEVLYFSDNFFNESKIEITYHGLEEISYKNKVNEKIGYANVKYNGKIIKKIDIIINEEIAFSLFSFIMGNIIIILIGGLSLALILKLLFRKRHHARTKVARKIYR